MMVLTLPAPAPIRWAAREHQAPSSPPCDITLHASSSRCPNALDQFSSISVPVFTELRDAVLQQRELRRIAIAIDDGSVAPAWSMDQGLLFFDGRLYIPAISPLLPDLLQIVKREGPAGWELIALGCHSTPTLAHHNTTPTGILLGCLWPTGTIPSVTMIFIDDLDRQLFRVDNVSIALHHGSNRQRLSPGEFDPGHFMFGVMLDLTMSPPTQSNAMI